MSEVELMARAAAPFTAIVRSIKPDQLSARTPCAEYDVQRLMNHLLFWAPSLEGAARKQSVLPPVAAESEVDLIGNDLEALSRTAAAWSEPEAWQGVTQMGGQELPGALVGGMVLVELVVHGWDLARATGQELSFDEELLIYLYDETAKQAGSGRQMGVYGPEVAVPDSAPMLDRILGLTGRDPAWG
ncbi:TIGR03086 family metal-binding protein [Kribbella sp. NPDC050124]|uniref:TIGR03086 family metal-binding protein n=1 Tax=Kribbella sp. NPDC050124 TaxID=3364114 RepID=UPI003790427B